jgi:ABC-type nitrate/sulfonate/bicarbonate transport system substrate-binding protein
MFFKKTLHALMLAASVAVAAKAVAQTGAPIEVNYGYTTADHVNLYVAQDLGLFDKAGIKARFFSFPSGAPLLAGLKSESLDVVTAGLGLAFALGQNIPLSIFYVNSNDATGEGLVVNEGSPIKSWKDIGKAGKIGAASGTCAQVALYLMAQKAGTDFSKLNVVNLPAPLLRNSFKSKSIDAGMAWAPYSVALDAEGFRVVSWDTEYTPGGVCPRMTAMRPAFAKAHPDAALRLLQVDAAASAAVARNPQLAVDALVKRLGLAPEVAKVTMERIYNQRPGFASQIDPASEHSLTSADAGLAGKLQLAMQVLHATKSIPEPVPMSLIRESIDAGPLKTFAARVR